MTLLMSFGMTCTIPIVVTFFSAYRSAPASGGAQRDAGRGVVAKGRGGPPGPDWGGPDWVLNFLTS